MTKSVQNIRAEASPTKKGVEVTQQLKYNKKLNDEKRRSNKAYPILFRALCMAISTGEVLFDLAGSLNG